MPFGGLFIDKKGNYYVLKSTKIIKFNKKFKTVARYKIRGLKKNRIAVDTEENVYLGLDDRIIKFDENDINK